MFECLYPRLNIHNSSTRSHPSKEEIASKIASVNRPLDIAAQSKYIQRSHFYGKNRKVVFTEIAGGHVLSKCPKERHSPPWNIKFNYVFRGVTASL